MKQIIDDVDQIAAEEVEKSIKEHKNTIPYVPMSNMPPIVGGTAIPLSLAGETLQAQLSVQEDIPDVDEYIMGRLGYTSKIMLADNLSAEQVDASVLAIRQIEKGKGFILADMAGIGKGRVCASVLRYAYIKGYLPIFITEADNLFTAIYRDLSDIGGIGYQKIGNPLIVNGFKEGGFDWGYDDKGLPIKIYKPSSTSILDREGNEIIIAPQMSEISEILKTNKLPAEYDYILLTYSQLSGKENERLKWLLRTIDELKGEAVIVMDEVHNATGTTSTTGQSVKEILMSVQGCLFSSATFSKRPENMFLYSYKTDMQDSPLTTEKLLELIKKGGERLIENLASNLVLAQQMIRRDRTYENCDVSYEYMSILQKDDLFTKYDTTITLYKELIKFFISAPFMEAKQKAILRFAEQEKVELGKPMPKRDKKAQTPKEYKQILEDWEKENLGKYELAAFSAGEISRSTFNFVESLLFALKADFVADQVIAQLVNNELENMNIDKTKFKSNRKPVVAIRLTMEGIFSYLGLKAGDVVPNADFSLYLSSMAYAGFKGNIRLKKIVKVLDVPKKPIEKKKKGEKKIKIGKEIKGEAEILLSDFDDKGAKFLKLQQEIEDVNLGIPLSPIDHIINKIQHFKRPDWEAKRYSLLTGKFEACFKVGEVTGRQLCLTEGGDYDKDGNWVGDKIFKLEVNPKNKNKSKTFKEFNNGTFDVLIINESGSTGEDAHSKKGFADTRPRVMVIHQVELDVATEVQKRGRINRTGMVNYPSYVYAVTRIPSEIRRLLMLAKKLRRLDANTTANQKQSAKLSTIQDKNGLPIEDISNKYGDECLIEFINIAENSDYQQYMPTSNQDGLGKMSNTNLVEIFTRNLELALCKDQETFYDTINGAYISKIQELGDNYDLESNIVNLKASIRTRVMVQQGSGTNPFNSNVYEEENFVLAQDLPYDNDKVQKLILELSKGQDAKEFFENFIDDYKKHFATVTLQETRDKVAIPDYDLAKDKEDAEKMKVHYEMKVDLAISKATEEYNSILSIFNATKNGGSGERVLTPDGAVLIPSYFEEIGVLDDKGLPIKISGYNKAKFIGVRLLSTAKAKYSPMNIELVFCQLGNPMIDTIVAPKIILKPTSVGMGALRCIVEKEVSSYELGVIKTWLVNEKKRILARMFTGNIMGAYSVAQDRVTMNKDAYSPVLQFIKFTTADNSAIRIAIRVNMTRKLTLDPAQVPVSFPLNSNKLIEAIIKSTRLAPSINSSQDFILEYNNKDILRVMVLGGNINLKKNRNFYSDLYDDGNFIELLNKKSPPFLVSYDKVSFVPRGLRYAQSIKTLEFSVKLTDGQKEVQEIFDYIYSQTPFNITLRGSTNEELIYDEGDEFGKYDKDGGEERVGTFRYETSVPLNTIKESLELLSKFDKIEVVSSFGNVYFNKRLNVTEALTYGLIPLDNNVSEMVSDTYDYINKFLGESEAFKFRTAISNAIKNGDNDFTVGMLVDDILKTKYAKVNCIFGASANNLRFIGQVFRAASKGEIELPKPQGGEMPKQKEIVKRPLEWNTAQEYVILLAYKLKS